MREQILMELISTLYNTTSVSVITERNITEQQDLYYDFILKIKTINTYESVIEVLGSELGQNITNFLPFHRLSS